LAFVTSSLLPNSNFLINNIGNEKTQGRIPPPPLLHPPFPQTEGEEMRVSISTRSAFHYETATLPSRYIYISSILFPLHQQQQPAKLFLEGKKEKRRDVYCISLILISYNNSNQMCPRSYTYIYIQGRNMDARGHTYATAVAFANRIRK
jgi:hypothetical protein